MKVFGLINMSIKVRCYMISVFVIVLFLLIIFVFFIGCVLENLFIYVYISNNNSRDVK